MLSTPLTIKRTILRLQITMKICARRRLLTVKVSERALGGACGYAPFFFRAKPQNVSFLLTI